MIKCVLCNNTVIASQKPLSCTKCKRIFHASCALNTADHLIDLRHFKKWLCLECENDNPFNRSSRTAHSPVTNNQHQYSDEVVHGSATTNHHQHSDVTGDEWNVLDVDNMDMKTAVVLILKRQDEMRKSLTIISKDIHEMRSELVEQRAQTSELVADIADLQKENKALRLHIERLDQYSRSNNFEIHGLADVSNENCIGKVIQVGQALKIALKREDIDICHPIKLKNNKHAVLCRLTRRTLRNDMIASARKLKITNRNLTPQGTSDASIYVNEQLSPYYRRLFAMANNLRKTHKWKYIWSAGSTIKLRALEGWPVLNITSEDDLSKITALPDDDVGDETSSDANGNNPTEEESHQG